MVHPPSPDIASDGPSANLPTLAVALGAAPLSLPAPFPYLRRGDIYALFRQKLFPPQAGVARFRATEGTASMRHPGGRP